MTVKARYALSPISHRHIVDQARAADLGGDEEPQGAIGGALDFGKGRGVARFEIVELEAGSFNLGAAFIEHTRDALAARNGSGAFLEHAIERRCGRTLLWREIGIARGHGEAVGLA